MPFSLKNCLAADKEKRPNPYSSPDEPPAKKAFKAPAAGSLVVLDAVPRIQRAARLPAVAPFLVCIYKAAVALAPVFLPPLGLINARAR